MTDHDTQRGHLENGLAAAYVDGRLVAEDLAWVEAHLAECDACRLEIVAVRRLLRRRTRRFAWLAVAGLGVAAALLLVLFRPSEQDGSRKPPLRGGDASVVEAPVAIDPPANAMISTESIRFTWRGSGAAVSYRLTLTDERGDVVWSTQTTDTAVVISRSVRLGSGRVYYWYVDALLPDGRSTTTGVHRFDVRP
jgi:hypothetical protein